MSEELPGLAIATTGGRELDTLLARLIILLGGDVPAQLTAASAASP